MSAHTSEPTTTSFLYADAQAWARADEDRAKGVEWQQSTRFQRFVTGVALTLNDIDPKVCLPARGSPRQYSAAVRDYLTDNPALLNRPAQVLIREALQRAFPCR